MRSSAHLLLYKIWKPAAVYSKNKESRYRGVQQKGPIQQTTPKISGAYLQRAMKHDVKYITALCRAELGFREATGLHEGFLLSCQPRQCDHTLSTELTMPSLQGEPLTIPINTVTQSRAEHLSPWRQGWVWNKEFTISGVDVKKVIIK